MSVVRISSFVLAYFVFQRLFASANLERIPMNSLKELSEAIASLSLHDRLEIAWECLQVIVGLGLFLGPRLLSWWQKRNQGQGAQQNQQAEQTELINLNP